MTTRIRVLDSQAEQFILDFYSQHQEDLEAIIFGGSANLPYINNPHDIDIIFIWKDFNHRKANLSACVQFNRNFKKYNIKYSCLNWFLAKYEEAFKEHWPVYAYLLNNYELVIGTRVPILEQFDILKYQNKAWDSFIDLMPRARERKWFYHILTTLYILWNQSYELTEEQKENIRIVHDQQDQEKIEELYQWALQQTQE